MFDNISVFYLVFIYSMEKALSFPAVSYAVTAK